MKTILILKKYFSIIIKDYIEFTEKYARTIAIYGKDSQL